MPHPAVPYARHQRSPRVLKQYDIVLLLQVLLIGLETNALAEEFLQLGNRRGFLIENPVDNHGCRHHQQLRGIELPDRPGDLAENLVGDGVDRFHLATSAAHRTRLAQRSEEHTSELQSLMRNSYAVF